MTTTTTSETAYYAVCNVHGPISVRLDSTTLDAAVAEFAEGAHRTWIDDARVDAEDDLDVCGEGLSEEEFAALLEERGAECVRDLSPVINAHAGTVAHLQDGWTLWSVA